MNIPSEKQAQKVRSYFVEYTVLFLVVCVITLFGLYYNLNRFITDSLMSDKVRMEQVIDRNTDALTNFKK